MESIKPFSAVTSARPAVAQGASAPPRSAAEAPSPSPVATDSVSLGTAATAEQPVLSAVETPVAAAPRVEASAPPPVTLTSGAGAAKSSPPAAQDEMAMVMEAFRGTPLEDCPEMVGVRDRLQHATVDIRSAASLPLLDVLTNPDPADARRQLSDISSALTWSQKFKKEARAAVDEGGFETLLERAQSAAEARDNQPRSLLDEVLGSPSLLKSGKLGDDQVTEANSLIQQFKGGNESPGIGSSTLGKGVMYLRGRRGTRIFYRMQNDRPEWLAVVNKGDEQSAINMLRKNFDLR